MVNSVAIAEGVDVVCLLGDNYHCHNVIRAEVMAFYRDWFKQFRKKCSIQMMSLVGNHDFSGEGHPVHAMMIHEDQIKVVDKPCKLGGVLFMPYYSDREKFVTDANSFPGTKTLVCHQTFFGSRYESGFLAEDGIEVDRIPQDTILVGHIHTPQAFGKVTYIGAPRWRSLSDANTNRAIWLYTFDDDGNAVEKLPFDTGEACRQIRYVLITPDDLFDGQMDPKHDWRVDIRGPSDFVAVQRKLWARDGNKVRSFITDRPAARVRESEGIGNAFRRYLKDYVPKGGTPIEVLEQMAKERLGL
jgi:DNA repair exonuclease SbcCD nuclease subunit